MTGERRIRLVYAALGVGLAFVLALATDTPIVIARSGLWFEILVWLVLAAFLLEPFFSGAPAAFVNAVSVVFFVLAAGFAGPSLLWSALVSVAGLAILLLIADFVLRDPNAPPDAPTQRFAKAARQIGTAAGSWRFSLTIVLLLSLVAFHPPFTGPWIVAGAVVLYALAVSRLQPHILIALLRGKPSPYEAGLSPVRVLAPSELLVTGVGLDHVQPGDLMTVSGSGRTADAIALAPSYAHGTRAFRVFVPDLRRVLHTSPLQALRLEPHAAADAPSEFHDYRAELQGDGVEAIGTVSDGTTMLDISVELLPNRTVTLGHLMWTLSAGHRTYWQIIDARVERDSWGGDTRRTVVGRGTQLGHWDQDRYSFQPNVGSPAHANLVFGGQAAGATGQAPAGYHVIGMVPNSQFPVAVDLHEFSRHHAAILGTTGTGKTHLAFDLAGAMANAGIKVICVDNTGQYAQRFPPPDHAHVEPATLQAYLASDSHLAVYTPDAAEHTIREGKALAEALFSWAKSQPPQEPEALARCVVIFEEAQNFVPEQFVIADDWNLKQTAQDTSRIIMESRKFGLGFILVSQRTAMVTKSALSQCNTILAFQAVDQTGLDYLEGLCGAALAHGIPTLPVQTAISMGRGMASQRPVIVRVADAPIVVP